MTDHANAQHGDRSGKPGWHVATRPGGDGVLIGEMTLPPDWLDHAPPLDLQRLWLTAAETERMERFRRAADQWRLLAGRFLLRSCLRTHFGIDFATFEFGVHNKPQVAVAGAGPSVDVNLTHDRNHVLAAFGTACEVGIDVAGVEDFAAWEEIAPGYLHPSEIAWVKAAAGPDRPWRALRLWALKEAILKSTGHGLDIDPRLIVLAPDAPDVIRSLPDDLPAARRFRLREWRCDASAGAALACMVRNASDAAGQRPSADPA